MVHTETSRESKKVDTDSHNGRSHLREILLSHTPGGAFNNAHMNKQNVKESCGMFCWICDLGCPSKSEQRCYCSCVDAFLRVSSQKCYLSNSSVASNKDEEFSSGIYQHTLIFYKEKFVYIIKINIDVTFVKDLFISLISFLYIF